MLNRLPLALGLAAGLAAPFAAPAVAQHVETEIHDYDFPFEGPFGSFDRLQLQRGLQIYTEVCAQCHGLQYVAIRNISDDGGPGLPEDQMRAYAAGIEVEGEDGTFGPASPQDHFPRSALENAPDLSLMAKARAGFSGPYGTGINQILFGMGGPEYIASLMTGYAEAPECAPEDFDGYYNTAFANGGYPSECVDDHGHREAPGSWIAMPPPLMGDDVVYADGTPTEVEQEAKDVSAFLMWAAEPKLMQRKQAGLTGVVFLTVLAVLLYLTNKRLWARHKYKDGDH
ncbi:cytochrome c1 [Pseudoroseicyclus aestuarii]|uniref:Cytochrome c1 n=1 Tax=Pseudoroseicyclus aestuarii TaxID=1795041 RepID=A0A318SVE3_9RHOB|nr:cytochrome c1 [Pseudoroseicyclus aestuarii]PYE84329.1 ubiquinol-cytochrome c reductase cytochrome c1 subunit [Pseudoroseicyclus aestuarii]